MCIRDRVPPIIDKESRFLNTYVRNWSMVSAALGAKAPGSLDVYKRQRFTRFPAGHRRRLGETPLKEQDGISRKVPVGQAQHGKE